MCAGSTAGWGWSTGRAAAGSTGRALFLGIAVSYSLFLLLSGHQPLGPVPTYVFLRLSALAALSMAIGLADDKWSLPPLAKLAGQVVVGLLVWLWAGLGFSDLWP